MKTKTEKWVKLTTANIPNSKEEQLVVANSKVEIVTGIKKVGRQFQGESIYGGTIKNITEYCVD